MRNKAKILATVTDSFDLKNHGRTDGNNRNYVVDTVKSMINSDSFKERLRLGELFGYFGHGRRELSNKMDLGEIEVVMKDGKPVVLENVPSNRTIDMSVSDDGIVTHTQEILDTPSGRAVMAMRNAQAGGWSWAVKGVESMKGALIRSFHGFDYVKHPSYIDTEKQAMMFESVGVDSEIGLMENMLESAGFDKGQAQSINDIWTRNSDASEQFNEITNECMMLEGALAEKQSIIDDVTEKANARKQMIIEAVKNSSVILSERQISALVDGHTVDDGKFIVEMFEAIGANPTLPNKGHQPSTETVKVSNPFADNQDGALFMNEPTPYSY